MEMDEIIVSREIEGRYQEYNADWDKTWSHDFQVLMSRTTIEAQGVSHLANLKANNTAMCFPFMWLNSIEVFSKTLLAFRDPETLLYFKEMPKVFKEKARTELGVRFSESEMRGFNRILLEMQGKAIESSKNHSLEGISERFWDKFIMNNEHMKLGIHSICKWSYADIYFTWETFLHSALFRATGTEVRSHNLEHVLQILFTGVNAFLVDKFTKGDIYFCKEIRHSIAHNDCKVSPKLEPFRDRLNREQYLDTVTGKPDPEKLISVAPTHIKYHLELVKELSVLLVNKLIEVKPAQILKPTT